MCKCGCHAVLLLSPWHLSWSSGNAFRYHSGSTQRLWRYAFRPIKPGIHWQAGWRKHSDSNQFQINDQKKSNLLSALKRLHSWQGLTLRFWFGALLMMLFTWNVRTPELGFCSPGWNSQNSNRKMMRSQAQTYHPFAIIGGESQSSGAFGEAYLFHNGHEVPCFWLE